MKQQLREMGTVVVRVGGVSLMAVSCALFFGCGGGGTETKNTTTTTTGGSSDTGTNTDPAGNTDDPPETGTTDSKITPSTTVATGTTSKVPASGGTKKVVRVAKIPVPKKLRTTKSPAKMSQFLVKQAKSSLKKKRLDIAIPLYTGLVVARGEGSDEAFVLAQAWVAQGDYVRAVEVLDRFIVNTSDFGKRSRARRVKNNLQQASNPFAKQFRRNRNQTRRYAGMAFKKGRLAFRKKRYADAQLYFRIGAAINPNLVGFLRELGATYDKLGMNKQKIKFYYRYLRRRPFGKNAATIRKALKKTKGLLTPLTISTSMKCQELWINGQKINRVKLPMKNVLVAPGKYRGLCLNYKHNFGMFENSVVRKGKPATLAFRWTVLVNALKGPTGRIALEDARTGKMRNLPLASRMVGVVVPGNNRALKVVLTSLNRSKKVERYIKFQPGQKQVIKW